MKYVITLCHIILIAFATNVSAKSLDELKAEAEKLNKAGSIAAKFGDVSKGKVSEADVTKKFEHLGPEITSAAVKWSKDGELKDAPPAFRRFLLFDYITRNTNVVAGASNPDELLINADASVETLFDDANIVKWAYSQMTQDTVTSKFTEIGNNLVGVFPMMPSESTTAQSCINCHASAEVGRPYPAGAKVLGYTFVAIPK